MSPTRPDCKSRRSSNSMLSEHDERHQLVVWALVVPSTAFTGAAVFILVLGAYHVYSTSLIVGLFSICATASVSTSRNFLMYRRSRSPNS
jgi:hypothetical protein